MEDPYQEIFDALDRRGGRCAPVWRFGTVLTGAPLAVDFGGTAQQGDSLLINEGLRNGLRQGDRVAALSEEDQRFVILCRVVDV